MDTSDPSFRTLLVENTVDLLSALREKTGMTAAIAVLAKDEQHGVVLASLPGMTDHSYVPRVGFRFDLHSTAPGKALLSYLPPTTQHRILQKIDYRRFTERTICDAETLLSTLTSYRKRRIVPDVSEYVEGVNCVASCVTDEAGHPLAAVWITSLAIDLPEDQLDRYGREVVSTVKSMSLRLRNASTSTTVQHHLAMEAAKSFIEQNFQDEPAVREYHLKVGMSDSWFRKLFKEKYGIAPMSYRLQLLHERARRLLLNTNLSIKEIAFQLGYDSQNYFSRTFKKYEGLSPAHFREQAKDTP